MVQTLGLRTKTMDSRAPIWYLNILGQGSTQTDLVSAKYLNGQMQLHVPNCENLTCTHYGGFRIPYAILVHVSPIQKLLIESNNIHYSTTIQSSLEARGPKQRQNEFMTSHKNGYFVTVTYAGTYVIVFSQRLNITINTIPKDLYRTCKYDLHDTLVNGRHWPMIDIKTWQWNQ